MSETAQPTVAWDFMTPRGVAAFAHARPGRLLLVQFIAALIAAGALVWFIGNDCTAEVGTAIQKLPASGEINSGRLDWMGDSPELLARGRFLALSVDLDHSGQMNTSSDLQIEFGRQNVRVFSLFGYMDFAYPQDYDIAFNRNELEPLWGAWAVELLLISAAAAVIFLLLSWWLLAGAYVLPLRLFLFYTNRRLNFHQCWRMASGALLPGALLMTAAVLVYAVGLLNLVSFLFAFVAHFIIGWIYLFLSVVFLPPAPEMATQGNPFKIKGKPRGNDDNPFKKMHGAEQ